VALGGGPNGITEEERADGGDGTGGRPNCVGLRSETGTYPTQFASAAGAGGGPNCPGLGSETGPYPEQFALAAARTAHLSLDDAVRA
jgi:hypothetical protein